MFESVLIKDFNEYILADGNEYCFSLCSENESHYNITMEYSHNDWDNWISFSVKDENGFALDYQPSLPRCGIAKFTVRLNKGVNHITIKHLFGHNIVLKKLSAEITSDFPLYISPKAFTVDKSNLFDYPVTITDYGVGIAKITDVNGNLIDFSVVPASLSLPSGQLADRISVIIPKNELQNFPVGVNYLDILFNNGKTLVVEISVVSEKTAPPFTVKVFNANHGNAVMLSLPNGKNLMIDSGEKNSNRFLTYFEENDINVDYFLLTHYHEDHYGNCDYIFGKYGITADDHRNKPDFIEKSQSERYDYLSKQRFADNYCFRCYDELHKIWDLGGVEITVLNSAFLLDGTKREIEYEPNVYNEYNYENTVSCALLIKYKNFTYFHGADTYKFIHKDIYDRYKKIGREDDLVCNFFFGNHHFHHDISSDFIKFINPEYVFAPSNSSLLSRSAYMYDYMKEVYFGDYPDKRIKSSSAAYDCDGMIFKIYDVNKWYSYTVPLK